MLALAERHVGDLAEAGTEMFHRADMAPVQLVGAVAEVVSAVGDQPGQHGVDVGLRGDKSIQRASFVLGMAVPELVSGT